MSKVLGLFVIFFLFLALGSWLGLAGVIFNTEAPGLYCSNATGNSSKCYLNDTLRLNNTYGEMYIYRSTASPLEILIDTAGTYHNLTNFTAGNNNGFSFTGATEANGGSYLTASNAGAYRACYSMSFFGSQAGGLYGVSIAKNFDHTITRNCYARREASTDVGSVVVCCLMELAVNDTVSIKVENENSNRNLEIHTANLNLNKI